MEQEWSRKEMTPEALPSLLWKSTGMAAPCPPEKRERAVPNRSRSSPPGRWRCTWAASPGSPGSHTHKGWRRKDPGFPVSEERQLIHSRFLPPPKLIHAVTSHEFGVTNETT